MATSLNLLAIKVGPGVGGIADVGAVAVIEFGFIVIEAAGRIASLPEKSRQCRRAAVKMARNFIGPLGLRQVYNSWIARPTL
jgi:hypothetical protein